MIKRKHLNSLLMLAMVIGLLSGCTKDSGDDDSGGDGVPGETCSLIGLDPKIINGTTCIEGRAAIVSIAIRGPEGAALCTGTMVTGDTVLTAAHCFQDISPDSGADFTIEVTGGPVGAGSQRANAVSVDIHPDFDLAVDQTLKNDVAYIKLERALDLNTLPILISRQAQIDDQIAIYGYGQDEEGRTGIPKSGRMTIEDISQDNIFADFVDRSSNTCTGDSGGPAIIRANGITGIVGVTSTGSATGAQSCSRGERSSFTNLANPQVIDWLRENIPGLSIR